MTLLLILPEHEAIDFYVLYISVMIKGGISGQMI